MKRSFLLLLALCGSFLALPAWAVNLSSSGSLPRGATTELQLTAEVSNVPLADMVDNNAEDTLRDKIEVYLEDLSTSKRIRYTDEPANEAFLNGYTVRLTDSEMVDEPAGTKLLNGTLLIEQGTGAEKTLQQLVTSGVVRVRLKYIPVQGDAVEKTVSADQKLGVVDEAPGAVTATSQHLGLAVSWTPVSQVTYNKGDADSPTSTKVILVDTSVSPSLTFDATTFQDDPAAETVDTTCAFTADVSAGTCSLEDCAGAHLDFTQIATLEGVRVATASYPANNTAFTNLDPEKSYAIIAAFEPDGLQRSACIMGQPKVNTTFIELNGGKEAKPGDPYCFIATAAYGTALHPHLDTLRWFRDNALLTSAWGRAFVNAYYEYAPPVARWLEQHEQVRAIVRGALWPIVNIIEWARGEPAAA